MALLDWIAPESGLRIEGDGVRLRPPRAADFAEWRELRAQSKEFLQPWEPTWPADDLTRAAFRRRLTAYARDREAGTAYPFFVFRTRDDALTGGITLSNVRRGVAQMGSIGYWCGQPFARQGQTLAAVRALTVFAFGVSGYTEMLIASGGAPPTVWWQLLAFVIITVAEVMVSITCLEFAYTQAPKRMKR